MKPDPISRKRFFLGGVLPLALLIVVLPVAPRFLAEAARFPGVTVTAAADLPFPNAPCSSRSELEGCNYMGPAENREVAEARRRAALTVVSRWETEYRRRGGLTRISMGDLQRLRRALL